MNYKNTRLAIASVIGALSLSSTSSFAATASDTVIVTATVTNACSITTTDHDFQAYDPLDSVGVTAGAGAVEVTCTVLTPYTIGLSDGNWMDTGTRRMKNTDTNITTNNFLEYTMSCILPTVLPAGSPVGVVLADLTGGTCVAGGWGETAGTGNTFTGLGLGPIALPIVTAGSIPFGQAVAGGSYQDTLTATIDY